jgi:hypothetical protein
VKCFGSSHGTPGSSHGTPGSSHGTREVFRKQSRYALFKPVGEFGTLVKTVLGNILPSVADNIGWD